MRDHFPLRIMCSRDAYWKQLLCCFCVIVKCFLVGSTRAARNASVSVHPLKMAILSFMEYGGLCMSALHLSLVCRRWNTDLVVGVIVMEVCDFSGGRRALVTLRCPFRTFDRNTHLPPPPDRISRRVCVCGPISPSMLAVSPEADGMLGPPVHVYGQGALSQPVVHIRISVFEFVGGKCVWPLSLGRVSLSLPLKLQI